MKRELTIKELSAYLPYGAKIAWVLKTETHILTMRSCYKSSFHKNKVGAEYSFDYRYCSSGKKMVGSCVFGVNKAYLILRPLSQLAEEITHNGERFVPKWRMIEIGKTEFSPLYDDVESDLSSLMHGDISYQWIYHAIVQRLLEWHFDIFGLIPDGLAVAMNPDGTINTDKP